jgi:hypothetical protein
MVPVHGFTGGSGTCFDSVPLMQASNAHGPSPNALTGGGFQIIVHPPSSGGNFTVGQTFIVEVVSNTGVAAVEGLLLFSQNQDQIRDANFISSPTGIRQMEVSYCSK